MRFPILAAYGLCVAALTLATQTEAHHSFSSEFDATRPVTVEGRITKVRIVNPHAWLYLDVTGDDGKVTNWGFEFGSPIVLNTKGLHRADLPAGSKIKISGFRSRNTGPYGYAHTAQLGDGRTFNIGSAPDAPSLRGAR